MNKEPKSDSSYQNFLLRHFSGQIAQKIYGATIDGIAFLAKLGVYLVLPFKFIQFFVQRWRRHSKMGTDK